MPSFRASAWELTSIVHKINLFGWLPCATQTQNRGSTQNLGMTMVYHITLIFFLPRVLKLVLHARYGLLVVSQHGMDFAEFSIS